MQEPVTKYCPDSFPILFLGFGCINNRPRVPSLIRAGSGGEDLPWPLALLNYKIGLGNYRLEGHVI